MKKIFSIMNPLRILLDIHHVSFYEGVVKPVREYGFRLDNRYWDTQRILALKYRLVAMLCVLSILASSYLISNRISYTEAFVINYPKISLGKGELSKDFPLRIYSYIHFWYSFKDNLSKKELENTFLKASFNTDIAQLIGRDLRNGSAELGGVIFYKDNALKFVVLESAFLPVVRNILISLDNEDTMIIAFKRYKNEVEKRFGDDIAIEAFNRWFVRDPGNLLAIKKYLQHAVFLSNYSYFLDIDSVMEQFYGYSQGSYIGNFHIHRYGDPVSQVDLDGSIIEDKYVIISKSNKKFQIARLKNGEMYFMSEQFSY